MKSFPIFTLSTFFISFFLPLSQFYDVTNRCRYILEIWTFLHLRAFTSLLKKCQFNKNLILQENKNFLTLEKKHYSGLFDVNPFQIMQINFFLIYVQICICWKWDCCGNKKNHFFIIWFHIFYGSYKIRDRPQTRFNSLLMKLIKI